MDKNLFKDPIKSTSKWKNQLIRGWLTPKFNWKSFPVLESKITTDKTPAQFAGLMSGIKSAANSTVPTTQKSTIEAKRGELKGIINSIPKIQEIKQPIQPKPESSKMNIAKLNNNPGNLVFVGQQGAEAGTDKGDGVKFAKFKTEEDGFNAMNRDIEIKLARNPEMTLRELISIRSPGYENDITQVIYNISDGLYDISQDNVKRGKPFLNGKARIKDFPRRRLLEEIAKSEGYYAN